MKIRDIPAGKENRVGWRAVALESQATKLFSLCFNQADDEQAMNIAEITARNIRLEAQKIEKAIKHYQEV